MMETSIPNVSVIIPTYNRAQWVCRAIQSILNQTCQDFEIIVVDDGSTDDTFELVRNYDNARVKYIQLSNNNGAAAARNMGVENSRGEYIAFLDSDDEAHPEWLRKTVEKILDLPKSWGVVYPNLLYYNDETNVIYPIIGKPLEGYIYDDLLLGHGRLTLTIGLSGAVVKKQSFNDVGGFDERLFGYHDYDLHYRLAQKNTFHFLNDFLNIIHEHQESRLVGNSKRRSEAKLLFDDKWKSEVRRVGAENALGIEKTNILTPRALASIVFKKGRLLAIKSLIDASLQKELRLITLPKYLIALFIGAYGYDKFRRWKNNLYWYLRKQIMAEKTQ